MPGLGSGLWCAGWLALPAGPGALRLVVDFTGSSSAPTGHPLPGSDAPQVRFANGDVCQTARYVLDLDPNAAASCNEFATPYMSFPFGEDLLVHSTQRLTLTQQSPFRFTQLITFTAIECSTAAGDCIGDRGGIVNLVHNSLTSADLTLATATPAEIVEAFALLRDTTYSAATATVVRVDDTQVACRLTRSRHARDVHRPAH